MKNPLKSKTLWVNFVLGATALFYPPAAEYIQSHPESVAIAFSVINMILRLVTKDPIGIE